MLPLYLKSIVICCIVGKNSLFRADSDSQSHHLSPVHATRDRAVQKLSPLLSKSTILQGQASVNPRQCENKKNSLLRQKHQKKVVFASLWCKMEQNTIYDS
ncbi:hypothetical protein AMECASPLE_038602 [Ameca splendens]|uniref:Uncharacterized protein n=1 Tax=Ameca splendens TaxID=208324 RepID=A0ABV0XLA8_9TELE